MDKSEFLRGEDVTSEGLAVATDGLDINAYRMWRKGTGNGGLAVTDVKVES